MTRLPPPSKPSGRNTTPLAQSLSAPTPSSHSPLPRLSPSSSPVPTASPAPRDGRISSGSAVRPRRPPNGRRPRLSSRARRGVRWRSAWGRGRRRTKVGCGRSRWSDSRGLLFFSAFGFSRFQAYTRSNRYLLPFPTFFTFVNDPRIAY